MKRIIITLLLILFSVPAVSLSSDASLVSDRKYRAEQRQENKQNIKQIKNLFDNHDKYANDHDIDKLGLLYADEYTNNLTTTKNLLSINKKIEVLIGFTNVTHQYQDYNILWFPQGIYAIIAANISHNNGGINISLTLHDKIAFLNGECGGTLPASIILNEVEDIDEDGNIVIKQPTIYQIIQ